MFKNINKKKLFLIGGGVLAVILILVLVLSLTMCNRTEPVDGSAVSEESSIVSEDSSVVESSEEPSESPSSVAVSTATSNKTAVSSEVDDHGHDILTWKEDITHITFVDGTKELKGITDDDRIEWMLEAIELYENPENLNAKVFLNGNEQKKGYFQVGMIVKVFDGNRLLGEYTVKSIRESEGFTFENREGINFTNTNPFPVYKEILIQDLINDKFAKERGFEFHFYQNGTEVKQGKVADNMTVKIINTAKNVNIEKPIKTVNYSLAN